MHWKFWATRLVLGSVLFLVTLACQSADILTARLVTTATPTRTPTRRATFTPIPSPTPIPPSPTLPPTPVPTATRVPTRRPPTPRPPTAVPPAPAPVVVAPPPGPTKSPYLYHANAPSCAHSGGTFIKARVYGNVNDPNSGVEGVKVALGGADGVNQYIPAVTTTWDGTYTFVLQETGSRPGTWYVWLIDGSGNRISDVGGPVITNDLGPDNGQACWQGAVDFWK